MLSKLLCSRRSNITSALPNVPGLGWQCLGDEERARRSSCAQGSGDRIAHRSPSRTLPGSSYCSCCLKLAALVRPTSMHGCVERAEKAEKDSRWNSVGCDEAICSGAVGRVKWDESSSQWRLVRLGGLRRSPRCASQPASQPASNHQPKALSTQNIRATTARYLAPERPRNVQGPSAKRVA